MTHMNDTKECKLNLLLKIEKLCGAWWRTPVSPKPRRLQQEDLEFKANLSYTARPCLTKRSKRNTKTKIIIIK